MVSSVLAIGAFFLVTDLAERNREVGADVLAVSLEAFGEGDEEEPTEGEEIGIAIPGTLAILGISFMACALLLAGLPPLSGFLAKFAILSPLLGVSEAGKAVPSLAWALTIVLVLSGLATLVAMTRTGINIFWVTPEGRPPRVRVIEFAPVALLLTLCLGLTVLAGPAMRYMEATAQGLYQPAGYVRGVLPGLQAGGGGGS
jgi:multicomponent K+:H+ antiporter subunit D